MDMTRISVCSYPLRQRPWREALPVLSDAGFSKVDLLGRAPHLSLDPAECDPAEIAAAAEDLGLHIANLGTYPGPGFASEDRTVAEAELAALRRALEIAASFGARSIRVRPGDDTRGCIERVAPWFAQAAEKAAEVGVYMGFETHGGGISGDPAQSVALCEAVGSPHFGVLYDPCNLMADGTDYRVALWTMREHIVHVHFKDAAVGASGFHYTMLGEGQIDFRWCVDMLDALSYTGDYAVEYELTDPAPQVGLPLWFEASQRI